MRTWTYDEGLIHLEGVGDIIDWHDMHTGWPEERKALCQFIVDACNAEEQRRYITELANQQIHDRAPTPLMWAENAMHHLKIVLDKPAGGE